MYERIVFVDSFREYFGDESLIESVFKNIYKSWD